MEKESRAMTCEEMKAENARLEQEVHALTVENGRLRSEVAAARREFEQAAERLESELAKARGDARPTRATSADSEEIDIEIPGVVSVHLKGRAALRFAGIEVPHAETEKMGSDFLVDVPS